MTREERAMIRKAAEKMILEPEHTPVALMGRGWISLLDEVDELEARYESDKHRIRSLENQRAAGFENESQLAAVVAALTKAARDYLDGWNLNVTDEEHGERELVLRHVLDGDSKEIAAEHDAGVAQRALDQYHRERLDQLLEESKTRAVEIDALIAKSEATAEENRKKLLAEGAAAERARFDHLCRLIQRQRKARSEMHEEPWTDELAEAEANLTDAMARLP